MAKNCCDFVTSPSCIHSLDEYPEARPRRFEAGNLKPERGVRDPNQGSSGPCLLAEYRELLVHRHLRRPPNRSLPEGHDDWSSVLAGNVASAPVQAGRRKAHIEERRQTCPFSGSLVAAGHAARSTRPRLHGEGRTQVDWRRLPHLAPIDGYVQAETTRWRYGLSSVLRGPPRRGGASQNRARLDHAPLPRAHAAARDQRWGAAYGSTQRDRARDGCP